MRFHAMVLLVAGASASFNGKRLSKAERKLERARLRADRNQKEAQTLFGSTFEDLSEADKNVIKVKGSFDKKFKSTVQSSWQMQRLSDEIKTLIQKDIHSTIKKHGTYSIVKAQSNGSKWIVQAARTEEIKKMIKEIEGEHERTFDGLFGWEITNSEVLKYLQNEWMFQPYRQYPKAPLVEHVILSFGNSKAEYNKMTLQVLFKEQAKTNKIFEWNEKQFFCCGSCRKVSCVKTRNIEEIEKNPTSYYAKKYNKALKAKKEFEENGKKWDYDVAMNYNCETCQAAINTDASDEIKDHMSERNLQKEMEEKMKARRERPIHRLLREIQRASARN